MTDLDRLLDEAGIKAAEIVERTGGQLSAVYEVRTEAEPVIVKVYAPEWQWKQAKEVHVYSLLEGLPVPQILHVGDTYTVLSKLEGLPLSELQPPDPRAIYQQLGELLKRIHTIRQPAYGYLTDQILDPLPDNDRYMRRQFAKKLDEFAGDPTLKTEIAQYVEKHAELFKDNRQAVLCHNDFYEGNILVDPKTWQVTGFIDVENAIAADPLIDLAKTIQYSIRGDAAKRQGLEDGYGEVPRERIDLYRLYHSLELWDWFHSIGQTDHLDSIAGDMAQLVAHGG
jgi:hygromycin-B 7''-O-kinase